MLPLTKLSARPGVRKDDTSYAAEGFYTDTNLMRWRMGKLQTVGGWELAITSQLLGICRTIVAWGTNQGVPLMGLGTNSAAYMYFGGLYDVTPFVAKNVLSNPFTTTNGSATVTVTDTTTNPIVGQRVRFDNASAFNNVTISGEYTVVTAPSATTYTITASTTANAGSSGGGTAVVANYRLAPGNVDDLGGLGYGTGGYSSGTYSTPSTQTDFALTYSIAPFGQNAIYNPRGGALYELAPDVTASETVTNGDFAVGTGWTLGANWSIAAGIATHTAGANDMSQSLALTNGSYYRLVFDATRSAGTLTVKIGSTTLVTVTAGNRYVATFQATGTQTLTFSADATYAGTIDNVSVKVEAVANRLVNAPSQVTYVFTTAERIAVALGSTNLGDKQLMTADWSGQQNLTVWTSSITNQSGDYPLSIGRRLVAGAAYRGENLLWSDAALFGMRYTGDGGYVFAFRTIGTGCGLIAPNAFATKDSLAFWVGNNGKFYVYEGGSVRPLRCPLERFFFDNLSTVQINKISIGINAAFNEVWINYPDARDGVECSRQIVWNWAEPSADDVDGTWSVHSTIPRTAYCDAGIWPYPLAATTNGYVMFQERGFTANGAAFPAYWAETAQFDIEDGQTLVTVLGMKPDIKAQQGTLTMTLTAYNDVNATPRSTSAMAITPTTRDLFPRITGRQITQRWDGAGTPYAFMREGNNRYRLTGTGMQR